MMIQSPMLYEEDARVYVRILQVGNTSMNVEDVIVRQPKEPGGKASVCYRSTARLVVFDHDKQTKTAISPAVRLAIERVAQRNRQTATNPSRL